MFAQHEQIHCAAWPAFSLYDQLTYSFGPEVNMNANQIYAMEGQCFVVQSCAVISQSIYDELVNTEQQAKLMTTGGGFSRIWGPDGATNGDNLEPTEEGLVIADINLSRIIMAKVAADPTGHYSRPDALALIHNKIPQRRVLSPAEADEQLHQHVLPKGLMRIRHYGLLANRCRRKKLEQVREALNSSDDLVDQQEEQCKPTKKIADTLPVCPKCRKGKLRFFTFSSNSIIMET